MGNLVEVICDCGIQVDDDVDLIKMYEQLFSNTVKHSKLMKNQFLSAQGPPTT